MAAKIILTIKFLAIWLYNGMLFPLPKILQMTSNTQTLPNSVLVFLCGLMFVPELLISFSKGFREWIQQGLEDADGSLNKSDMKDMIVFYGSLWSLRVFLIFSWMIAFYQVDIAWYIYVTPLIGSFGMSGLTVIKSWIGVRKG